MHYVLGLLAIMGGVAMIVKTQWLIENIGTNAWAEANLGTSGGSRLLYKLIGLILIFLGFLIVTNMYMSFLFATVGKIFIRN